jgi:hypothetical protein
VTVFQKSGVLARVGMSRFDRELVRAGTEELQCITRLDKTE